MTWLDVGKAIIKYGAPMLGFAVGGPAGASIAGEIANLFGADSSDPQDVLKKIQSDPDAKIKLAQIEANKSVELQNIALESMKAKYEFEGKQFDIEEKDVEDARKMKEETHDKMPDIISILVAIAFFCTSTIFFFYPIPPQNNNIVCILAAALLYEFLNVCRFHLGGKIPTLKDLQSFKAR